MISRTYASFETHLKKGILIDATTYVLPSEICAMVNVVLDAKNQSLKLCAVDGVDVVSLNIFLSVAYTILYIYSQLKNKAENYKANDLKN